MHSNFIMPIWPTWTQVITWIGWFANYLRAHLVFATGILQGLVLDELDLCGVVPPVTQCRKAQSVITCIDHPFSPNARSPVLPSINGVCACIRNVAHCVQSAGMSYLILVLVHETSIVCCDNVLHNTWCVPISILVHVFFSFLSAGCAFSASVGICSR